MISRTAQLIDLVPITNLMNEFHTHKSTKEVLAPQLKLLCDSDSSDVILIEDDDGNIVGMSIVALLYKLPKIECRINEVIVSSDARGKGYGKHLVESSIAWAWKHGADQVEFSSRPSREAANKLYQNMGFIPRETNVYAADRPAK